MRKNRRRNIKRNEKTWVKPMSYSTTEKVVPIKASSPEPEQSEEEKPEEEVKKPLEAVTNVEQVKKDYHLSSHYREYSFEEIDYNELDDCNALSDKIINSLQELSVDIKLIDEAINTMNEKEIFLEARICDLLHILQIGSGKIDGASIARIAKEIKKSRIYREKVKREKGILCLLKHNCNLPEEVSKIRYRISNLLNTYQRKVYCARTISRLEAQCLVNVNLDTLPINFIEDDVKTVSIKGV